METEVETTVERKTYMNNLPMPHGAFMRLRLPVAISAITEESDGRTLISPPVGMEQSAAYRWRVAQREL